MTCVCGFKAKLDPGTAAWHRAHRVVHVEVFPMCDEKTVTNLDQLVRIFERNETRAG